MKISKRVREEAAMICAIAASTNWQADYGDTADDQFPMNQGWSFFARLIAYQAHRSTLGQGFCIDGMWAEAEAKLRCGWSPGDET